MNAPISREYKWGGLGVGWAISIFQVNFYFQFYLWFFFLFIFFSFSIGGVWRTLCAQFVLWHVAKFQPYPAFRDGPCNVPFGPHLCHLFLFGGIFFSFPAGRAKGNLGL